MPTCDGVGHLLRTTWFITAATVLMTTQPFITTLTKNGEGKYDYAPITTTFLAEAIKLLISIGFYSRLPADKRSHNALRARDVFQFAVPAFVYFINNNLIFIILMYVNSTTYQILSALKTVATGILFRVILKRMLAPVQKTAILLLACGAAVSQFPICTTPTYPSLAGLELIVHEANQTDANISMVLATATDALAQIQERVADDAAPASGEFGGVWIGVAVALFACFNSAFAGVYSELLLKKDGSLHSIHLQNMMLYGWGIGFNAIALYVKDGEWMVNNGIFAGYSPTVWLLVTNNALNGLAISAILKFADNIVRVFAHTAAMMLTMVLELVFMDLPFSPQILVSITIVMCSTFLYNSKPPPPKTMPTKKGMQPMDEELTKLDEGEPSTRRAAPMSDDIAYENGDGIDSPKESTSTRAKV